MLLCKKQNAVVGSKKREGSGGLLGELYCHNRSEKVISGSKRIRPSIMKIAIEAEEKKKMRMTRDYMCEREISNND